MIMENKPRLVFTLLVCCSIIVIVSLNLSVVDSIRNYLVGVDRMEMKYKTRLEEFLPNFRNPCWYEPHIRVNEVRNNPICDNEQCQFLAETIQKEPNATARLRCLPYFFIIGPQKCGTTELYEKMLLHPHIVGGLMKEPHYWTWKRPKNVSLEHYTDLFGLAAKAIDREYDEISNEKYHYLITGEGSATTLWDNWDWQRLHPQDNARLIPHRIRAEIPNARIIAIVREPVKRLVSDFLYFNRDLSLDFGDSVKEGVEWLENCYQDHNRTHCMYSRVNGSPRGADRWTPVVRLRLGMYSELLEDWMSVFPAEQIHVVLLDDYSADRLSVLNGVFHFLGLEPLPDKQADSLEAMQISNKGSGYKYRSFGNISNETLKMLHDFHKPFNDKLSRMLKKPLPW